MNRKHKSVRLARAEQAYLMRGGFLPESLARLVATAESPSERECFLLLSREIAEQFRAALTIHLARVGFDTEYELTSEGKMIEELIDRFYMSQKLENE